MATIEDNLAKLQEGQLERLLKAFEARSKDFQRLFSGLMIFALIFLFIILLPYISLLIEKQGSSQQLKTLEDQLAPIETRLQVYQQAQEGIQELRDQLQESPNELHQYINTLDTSCKNASDAQSQVSQTVSPSSIPDCPSDQAQKDAWVNEQVQAHVQGQFDDFKQVIEQGVVTPLHSLDATDHTADVAVLTKGLANLNAAFTAQLNEHPNFWKKFEDKILFYSALDQQLNGVWSDYASAIEVERQRLETESSNLEAAKRKLEEQQKQLESQEAKISERLDQIEFPFGKIPLGLRESVLVFPLILAVGFFLCTTSLRDMIRIRASVQNLYRQKDPDQKIMSDSQIALVAPLPVDPIGSKQEQIVQLVILFIPLLVFIAACSLTFYSWRLATAASGVPAFQSMYGILYPLGFILFIYAYRRILVELRRYGKVN